MNKLVGAQCGSLLAAWLSKHSGADTAKAIAREIGYNDSPLFGAEKKRITLMAEVVMANAAIAISCVNQVFEPSDAQSIIDPFLAEARKHVFSILESKDPAFKHNYERRMAEYFPILMGQRPPLGLSLAFMKHLKVDPLKNAQGQAALATRFATAAKETVEALQVLARRAGVSSGERQRPYETKDAIAIKVAAVNGDVRAKSMLGRMYFKGEGVPQDHAEAAIWLHGAAEAGDADAQGLLGMAYEEGLGVSRDYSKAAELYRKAAEQGIDAAAYFLGNLFLEGKGVAKDSATAAKWFLASAQAGNTGAQGVLLALYMYGEGVSESVEDAYFWALVAAREKHPVALQLSPEIAGKLSPTKRAEIAERARRWMPKAMNQG